jgi:hypothetical protein
MTIHVLIQTKLFMSSFHVLEWCHNVLMHFTWWHVKRLLSPSQERQRGKKEKEETQFLHLCTSH